MAIVSRVSRNPYFPDIIGTGFIVREDGFILTCKHVLDLISRLPKRRDAPLEEWPALVLLLHMLDEGMVSIPLSIKSAARMELTGQHVYYGEQTPDVALIRVNAVGLPSLQLPTDPVFSEGEDVFVGGFPMGVRTLLAPGWIHQISPTLQHAIVSAVLPFPCEMPHALLLDVVTEGGSSGSPVFSA